MNSASVRHWMLLKAGRSLGRCFQVCVRYGFFILWLRIYLCQIAGNLIKAITLQSSTVLFFFLLFFFHYMNTLLLRSFIPYFR